MKSIQVLLSLVAFAAAGTLIGVLFAPEKGEKTRKQLFNKGEDYAGAMKDRLDQLLDNIAKKQDHAKKKMESFASNDNVGA